VSALFNTIDKLSVERSGTMTSLKSIPSRLKLKMSFIPPITVCRQAPARLAAWQSGTAAV